MMVMNATYPMDEVLVLCASSSVNCDSLGLLKNGRRVEHADAIRMLQQTVAGAGGANRSRTGDLLRAKQALSQLSYGPNAIGGY